MDTFDRIEKLLKERSISGAKMSKDLKFSSGLYSQWKKRSQSPSKQKIVEMALYFDVDPNYLLGTTDNPNPPIKLSTKPIQPTAEYASFGEKYNDIFSQVADTLETTADALEDYQKYLIASFDELSEEDKKVVLELIEFYRLRDKGGDSE